MARNTVPVQTTEETEKDYAPIKVKMTKRWGITAGAWYITREQAQQICRRYDLPLPRMGYVVRIEEGEGYFRKHATVAHVGYGFRLSNDSGLIPVKEEKDGYIGEWFFKQRNKTT